MFNTLKEMQETLPYEDLYKYASESLDKSPVEIKELLKSYNVEISDSVANECYEYIKKIDIVSEEELENVSGGTCVSSGTYNSLNAIYHKYEQKGEYHPIITTIGNHCGYTQYNGDKCKDCSFFTPFNGISGYCGFRSKEHDRYSN